MTDAGASCAREIAREIAEHLTVGAPAIVISASGELAHALPSTWVGTLPFRRRKRAGPKPEIIASPRHLPFAPRSLDALIASDQLSGVSNIDDAQRMVASWGGLLRPGGMLAVVERMRRGLFERRRPLAEPEAFAALVLRAGMVEVGQRLFDRQLVLTRCAPGPLILPLRARV